MQRRPSRTASQKLQQFLPAIIVVLLLYVLATHDYWLPLGIITLYIILRLVIQQDWLIETLNLILASLKRPKQTLPYYQPSQQTSQEQLSYEREQASEHSSYERGYQEQPYYQPAQEPPAQQKARPLTDAGLRDVSPAEYEEQPQAQYPEPPPLM